MDRGATVRISRLFAAVALMGSASAFALDVDPAFDRFKAVVTGNAVEVKFSATGVPLAGSGGPLTATGVSGAGYLSRSASIATQHGPLPFTVSQRFSVASLAKGAAAIATNPLLAVGLAIAAPFIADWFSDAGISSDGGGNFTQLVTSTVYRAYDGRLGVWYTGQLSSICQSVASSYQGAWGGSYTVAPTQQPLSCNMKNGTQNISVNVQYVSQSTTSEPIPQSQLASKLEQTPRTLSEIERILSEGIKYPELTPDPADTPQILDPQPSPSKTSSGTTVDPTTGTTTQTRSCSMIGSPSSSGNVITVSEICTTATTTVPPGGTTGTTVVGTTTTGIGVSVGSGQPTETPPFEMPCGVGSAPPCAVKIDESGTPPPTDGDNSQNESGDAADAGKNQILDKIEELEDWSLPGWSWTFSLPTGCTPLPMFLGVVVDPCQWIDEIHSIMSVIWVLTGIAGMFVIFAKAD